MTIARTRRLLFARAVAAVSFVAVGASCSSTADSGGPTKLPPPVAVAPAPTPTPTPTPEAEVEAAVRSYFAVANDAMKSGDTTKLVTLSRSSCQCRALIDGIMKTYASGSFDNARFDVDSVVVKEVVGITAGAEVKYVVPNYSILDRQGHETEAVPEYDGSDFVSLVRSDAGWLFDSTFNLKADTRRQ